MKTIACVRITDGPNTAEGAYDFATTFGEAVPGTLLLNLTGKRPDSLVTARAPKPFFEALAEPFHHLRGVVSIAEVWPTYYAELGCMPAEAEQMFAQERPQLRGHPQNNLTGHLLKLNFPYVVIAVNAEPGWLWKSTEIAADYYVLIVGEGNRFKGVDIPPLKVLGAVLLPGTPDMEGLIDRFRAWVVPQIDSSVALGLVANGLDP